VQRLAALRYWDWVAAGQRREVVRGLLAIARDRDGQLAARAGAGDVARFDQQDNRRAVVQREGLLVQAQRGVEQAALALSLFLRDERGEPVVPDEARLPSGLAEPDPTLGEAVALEPALARRPDVRQLETQRQQLDVERRLARNQLLPALDVGVAVSKDLGGAPRPELASWGQTELEVSAVLEVPLLFRAPLGKLRSAEASLAKLEARLQLARDRAAVEVHDAVSALRAARQRITLTRQEVALAVTLEQGERTRFDLGDSTLLFVNLREQATVEARLKEVDALAEFQKAAAALRVALAVPVR
jgi:outer membrane protein TolC